MNFPHYQNEFHNYDNKDNDDGSYIPITIESYFYTNILDLVGSFVCVGKNQTPAFLIEIEYPYQ